MEWILCILLGLVLAIVLVTRRETRQENDVWHPDTSAAADADAPDDGEDDDEMAPLEPVIVRATVLTSCRAMDPLALTPGSIVTFRSETEEKCTLQVPGSGGTHLLEGDTGLLTVSGDTFISFEKDNGEVIGALYYIPAEEAQE